MIVHDHAGNRALLAGLLEDIGFQVAQASSGQAAAGAAAAPVPAPGAACAVFPVLLAGLMRRVPWHIL